MMKNKFTKKLTPIIPIIIVIIIAMELFCFSHSTYWKYPKWCFIFNIGL